MCDKGNMLEKKIDRVGRDSFHLFIYLFYFVGRAGWGGEEHEKKNLGFTRKNRLDNVTLNTYFLYGLMSQRRSLFLEVLRCTEIGHLKA